MALNLNPRRWFLLATVAVGASALLSLLSQHGVALSGTVLVTARWIAILVLLVYGLSRKSLTAWILIAMFTGASLGHDWPSMAVSLRVVGLIFLRLIKTVVAPLLFATLVSGIASHANLRKVGRMGIKAIVYFELVTTLALIIGLVAINVSRAGVGTKLPAASPESLQVQKLTASETK